MAGMVPDVPMTPITVRFGPAQLQFIAAQADREGVSTAQFVRDAAFGRAILQWAASAAPKELTAMRDVLGGQASRDDLDVLERIALAMYRRDDP